MSQSDGEGEGATSGVTRIWATGGSTYSSRQHHLFDAHFAILVRLAIVKPDLLLDRLRKLAVHRRALALRDNIVDNGDGRSIVVLGLDIGGHDLATLDISPLTLLLGRVLLVLVLLLRCRSIILGGLRG